jgi:hypothetical protein
MNEVIDEELITVSVSMSVEAYELLLAHAKVMILTLTILLNRLWSCIQKTSLRE